MAFPTETVYGLRANALDAQAVARVLEAKGRPAGDPLIVHLASADDLPRVARDASAIARELVYAFWPGPLTLVLPKQRTVPANVTAGLETVAVRVPAHSVALALLRMSGVPIAAPSANRFGGVNPTTAQHVLNDLGDRIDLFFQEIRHLVQRCFYLRVFRILIKDDDPTLSRVLHPAGGSGCTCPYDA